MPTTIRQFTLIALLASSIALHESDALLEAASCKTRNAITSTSAINFQMQIPEFSSQPQWYDVANPTARRITYDE